jgi:dual-specificity kinase
MQAAIHHLPPQIIPQYTRQSLNGILNPMPGGPTVMPTPPVASRKRKRAHQYTVSYSEVQEVDSEGKLREVIVIEDTPPPPTTSPRTTHGNGFSASYQPPVYTTQVRTRARAAAEAQALSASASSVAIPAPPPKKRKRDHADETRLPPAKKTVVGGAQPQPLQDTKSWASGSGGATDEVSRILTKIHVSVSNQPTDI